jgi:uncharacterized protein YlxP (DUF503 family)
MTIALLTATIYIPGAVSLKDKRQVLQPLMKRLRNKFNVAIAEVAAQDLHQKSELGLVSINTSSRELQRTMDLVVSFIQGNPDSELLNIQMEML